MPRDMRNWMWAEALELLDRAQRAPYRPGNSGGGRREVCWEPPVDVLETQDALWIQVALPGVTLERLQVRIEGDQLVVSGERPMPLPAGAGVIHRMEQPHGRFERRLGLPPGNYEIERPELALGCLTVTLRKLA
jgi:HSP20 family molecular chaperone IbpA